MTFRKAFFWMILVSAAVHGLGLLSFHVSLESPVLAKTDPYAKLHYLGAFLAAPLRVSADHPTEAMRLPPPEVNWQLPAPHPPLPREPLGSGPIDANRVFFYQQLTSPTPKLASKQIPLSVAAVVESTSNSKDLPAAATNWGEFASQMKQESF